MSEGSVTFYVIESEFWPVAYRAIEKMYSINENVLFLCDNDEEASFYSTKLWTVTRLSFIPNGDRATISSEDAEFCHTWFSTEVIYLNNPSCLIHNGLDAVKSSDIRRFLKIIDIFDASAISAAGDRAKFYRASGFDSQKVWIKKHNTWEPGQLS
jgi:DNA polymerase IIIc chi subunit